MDHSPDSGPADTAARAAAAAILLVSHPGICQNQQLMCSLLQVSRAMRDCISQHAPRGLLPVSLHRKRHLTAAQTAAAKRAALQLASWLRDHSSLVGSISLSLPEGLMDAVQDGITAALQHAAATPPGLLLRSVTTNIDSMALLQCLPSAQLTQLEFAHRSNDATAQVADILAGITALCSLRVVGDDIRVDHGPFLAVLGAHTRLTSLEVGYVGGEAEYGQHLPASLQKLHISGWSEAPMHLAHATALTDLSPAYFEDGDDLPPNVQLLMLPGGSGSSVGPFVALQHLRELHLGQAENLPQPDLVQLRDLTALSRLTLDYCDDLDDDESVDQAAQAWRQLTFLRELHIGEQSATASTLQAIGSLAQSLESLTLSCKGVGTDLVVDTLRMLSSLTRLSLSWFSDQHLAALPDISQLNELELVDADLGARIDAAAALARAQHLAMATQLTKLVCVDHVEHPQNDFVLSLSALTHLRHLDISETRCTDAVLPVFVGTMPHLTQLDAGTTFSDEGRAVLAAARPDMVVKHERLQQLQQHCNTDA